MPAVGVILFTVAEVRNVSHRQRLEQLRTGYVQRLVYCWQAYDEGIWVWSAVKVAQSQAETGIGICDSLPLASETVPDGISAIEPIGRQAEWTGAYFPPSKRMTVWMASRVGIRACCWVVLSMQHTRTKVPFFEHIASVYLRSRSTYAFTCVYKLHPRGVYSYIWLRM